MPTTTRAHVRQAGSQLAGLAGHRAVRVQRRGIHAGQRCDERAVRQCVEQEDRTGADSDDEEPGHRGPDHPCRVERGTVQTHRIGQIVPAHHLQHERLASGVVHGGHQAKSERENIHMPDGDHTAHVQHPEGERHQRHAQLGGNEQATLRVPVGEHPAPQPEEQHRQELQAGGDAQGGPAAVGQLEDQPVLGDTLHPGADIGYECASEPAPVVRHRQ